ncbi:MAG: lysostaphin resistance A-like protein [Vulcanimicrobiota bacterium]
MRIASFLGCLLGAWVVTWLGLGTVWGDPLLLLTPSRASEPQRITYLLVLFALVSTATAWRWRCSGPVWPGFGRPALFGLGLLVGVVSSLVHRGLLFAAGAYHPPALTLWFAWILVSVSVLAVLEESVFRGYLFGVVYQDHGRMAAYVGVGLFFALVHLFRPGGLVFKLCYAVGLLLTAWVLSRVVEHTRSLWAAAGLHAGWITFNVLDAGKAAVASPMAGYQGEVVSGWLGWLLLLGLLTLVERVFPAGPADCALDEPPEPVGASLA